MKRRLEVLGETPDGRPSEAQPRWRKDFPIDVPQDHFVSRRDFAKFLGLVSGAFLTGQLWLGVRSLLPGAREPAPARIATLAQLPVGGVRAFTYPTERDPALLIRLGERSLVAYDSRCTHLLCPVIPRLEEGVLACPCHRGYFDVEQGHPIAGPPQRPLTRIALEVRDGAVYAAGVERRTM